MQLRRPAPSFVLLPFLATLALPAIARAWPHDPVSGNTPVCTVTGVQQNVQALPTASGGVFLVWEDYRSGSSDLYGKYLTAQGLDLIPEFTVCAASGNQVWPRLCSDDAGGVIVSWEDHRAGAPDIYVQRFDANGARQWADGGVVVCDSTDVQDRPVIAPDGNGGAIIAWQDRRAGNYDIYAQGVDSYGTPLWVAGGAVMCGDPFDQFYPTIASDSHGGAVIAWQDERNGNPDIYVQRTLGGGVMFLGGWPLCTATGVQMFPVAAPDGVDGAIVAWTDQRSLDRDVYAARVTRTGSFPWAPQGVVVSAEVGNQQWPVLVTDGAAGSFLAWTDQRSGEYDVYAQRLTVGGGAAWYEGGVPVCVASGTQAPRALVSDGAGGVIVAWDDVRHPGADVYSQRLGPEGSPRWDYNGIAVSAAIDGQSSAAAVSDGRGGVVVAWTDHRSGESDIYAQRVDYHGKLGEAEPVLVRVQDIPNDQGGRVKLWWDASYLDAPPFNAIAEYRVLRSVPPHRGAQMLRGGSSGAASSGIVVTNVQGKDYYWELLGVVRSLGVSRYSYVAATAMDSVTGSNPRTVFMIQAHDGIVVWNSAPDSGYSVDNLAPSAPAGLVGLRVEGASRLHWVPSSEADFAEYRLYRGATDDFVPTPGNVVSTQTDTGFVDPAPGPGEVFYKLSAVDLHGNESRFARVSLTGSVGVTGPGAARGLWLAPPNPNPAPGSAMIRWSLPTADHVEVEIVDAQGRRVRSLLRGWTDAGESAARWDGRSELGTAAPNGVYFVRLVTSAESRWTRLLLLR